MVRDLKNMGGMDSMRGAEPGDALEDRCAVDTAVEEEVQEAGVDRNSVMLGSIAQIN